MVIRKAHGCTAQLKFTHPVPTCNHLLRSSSWWLKVKYIYIYSIRYTYFCYIYSIYIHIYKYIYIYAQPKTNVSIEHRPSQKKISSSNHWDSRAILSKSKWVSGRVLILYILHAMALPYLVQVHPVIQTCFSCGLLPLVSPKPWGEYVWVEPRVLSENNETYKSIIW